jgi:RHS repeat-associated protein
MDRSQQQYRYDCANRLVQVSDASGNVLATYAYGASNQRLMSVEGGVTKYFAWAMREIVAEYEAWGTNALIWKTSYVYLGGRLLATTSGADGTEMRFHHPARLGTRLATAVDGTVVTEQFTMPFGNMQPFTSVYGGENPYQNPALANPSKQRFTSYDRSDATTLDYAKNRFYSPQQGRFTQVDPIGMSAASLGDPQSLNLYSYCGNDPVNFADPSGLDGISIGINIGISIGISIGRAIRTGGGIRGAAKAAAKAAIRVISAGRGAFTGPGFRTPPTFPGSLPGISIGSSGRLGGFRTPPFVKSNLYSATSSFFALAQQRSDCGRFVDNLVGRVEKGRVNPKSPVTLRTLTTGQQLIDAAWWRSKQLGTQPFDGFKDELTRDHQNDGVYQHVLGHAGATMVGDRMLEIPIKSGITGGKWAFTGTQLTTYAKQEDERQRDDPTLADHKLEAETEIRDDDAGRQVGGQMVKGLSGEINSEQLRRALFDILCHH